MTARGVVEVREVAGAREFVAAQAPLYVNDPRFAAPPELYVRRRLDVRREPFWAHAERALFVARRGDRLVGRVAAIANHLHNGTWGDRAAFFGLFESENDLGTAELLLGAAARWAQDRGYDCLRGPTSFSVHDELGLLVEGFQRPARIMMPYNPPYYEELLLGAGFRHVRELLAYDWSYAEHPKPPELLERLGHEASTRVDLRQFDLRQRARETTRFREVYNAAFADSWGFVPITPEEADSMVADFSRFGDPQLCWLAEVDGEAAGFLLLLPDLHVVFHALRRGPRLLRLPRAARAFWRPQAARLVTLAVAPRFQRLAVAARLLLKIWHVAPARGIQEAEFSYVDAENHAMNTILRQLKFRVGKRYRIFERQLEGGT